MGPKLSLGMAQELRVEQKLSMELDDANKEALRKALELWMREPHLTFSIPMSVLKF